MEESRTAFYVIREKNGGWYVCEKGAGLIHSPAFADQYPSFSEARSHAEEHQEIVLCQVTIQETVCD